jgi:hypothetical protein
MSDQQTPETDAAMQRCACGDYIVEPDFARKLERERDELLAALERVLASASPNPRDNPAMYPVWEFARAAIAAVKGGKL